MIGQILLFVTVKQTNQNGQTRITILEEGHCLLAGCWCMAVFHRILVKYSCPLRKTIFAELSSSFLGEKWLKIWQNSHDGTTPSHLLQAAIVYIVLASSSSSSVVALVPLLHQQRRPAGDAIYWNVMIKRSKTLSFSGCGDRLNKTSAMRQKVARQTDKVNGHKNTDTNPLSLKAKHLTLELNK